MCNSIYMLTQKKFVLALMIIPLRQLMMNLLAQVIQVPKIIIHEIKIHSILSSIISQAIKFMQYSIIKY